MTTTERQIKITNVYDNGDEIDTFVTVDVRDRLATESVDDWRNYVDELLWPLTGTGRETGHACYFAESVDGFEPSITIEWC